MKPAVRGSRADDKQRETPHSGGVHATWSAQRCVCLVREKQTHLKGTPTFKCYSLQRRVFKKELTAGISLLSLVTPGRQVKNY